MTDEKREPAPPENKNGGFTDFGPDELRWLADVVEQFEQLYITTARMADLDTVQPTWPVAIRFGGLPVRVVCGENCWVLRVGGDDD